MDTGTLQTLETAAQILMAAPNLVSSEQRHQAESVFLQFRTTKNPYGMCREILESSRTEFLLFEAVGLLKIALIREWSLLTDDDKLSLREYLLRYLMERDLTSSLKGKMLQTVAIMVKRGSIDDAGKDRQQLISQLEMVILNSEIKQRRIACALLQALLHEFAITVKSADVGLYWAVHLKLKKQFEVMDLKRIFRFIVGILEQLVRSGSLPEGEEALLVKQLLTLVEAILCWSHLSHVLPKRLMGSFEAAYESDNSPALRLGVLWKDTILQPELLTLFFELHLLVRNNPDLLIPSITCLVQLASLSGAVVYNAEESTKYFQNYISKFDFLLQNIQPLDREMLGLADMARKVVHFFTPTLMATIDSGFFERLTTMTCHCIRGAIAEEASHEDTVWGESLTRFFEMWGSIVSDTEAFPGDILRNNAIEIFNTYLQCRLSPPDGTRVAELCSEELQDDIEEDERELHRSVLLVLGAIARKAVDHVTRVLTALLVHRASMLEEQLGLMHAGKMPITGGEQLVNLFEDLHWILMIAGHFLSLDCKDGEVTLVPLEIIKYSIAENADRDATLMYFLGKSTNKSAVDSIVRLISLILRVADSEVLSLNAGLGPVYSPELSATISWLLSIWAQAYLTTNRKEYTEMSPNLSCCALGASRLVMRAGAVIRAAHTQPAAARHALQLLRNVATIKDTTSQHDVAKYEQFVALVEWEAMGNNLPGSIRKELHKVFAKAALGLRGEKRSQLLRASLLLATKLNDILNMNSDTEPVRNMLADTLDCVIGVAEVSLDEQELYMNVLEKLPAIFYKYHNYPSVVLPGFQILSAMAEYTLHLFSPENATRFDEICVAVLQIYVRWNNSRFSQLPEDAEEEAFQDLTAMMDLVTELSSCAYFVSSSGSGQAASVGLRAILPLVSASLLANPTLVHKLYRTLRDFPPDMYLQLPQEDFAMVMNALNAGLTCSTSDVANLTCDAISSLCDALNGLPSEDPRRVATLSIARPLLHAATRLLLTPDRAPSMTLAVFRLASLQPGLIESVGNEIVKEFSQSDPSNGPQLEEAFAELTKNVIFDGQIRHNIQFRDRFDKFIVNIQGFLIIK